MKPTSRRDIFALCLSIFAFLSGLSALISVAVFAVSLKTARTMFESNTGGPMESCIGKTSDACPPVTVCNESNLQTF